MQKPIKKQRIRKAVFPVAGLGTRFLPATKASPKEMLTVVDRPLIQYAVEEAVKAGIDEVIFVTSDTKRAIEDHFDVNIELENKLKKSGKSALLAELQNILPVHVTCVYTRQHEALGLGHAVLCAKKIVGDEPFAVLLADDLIYSAGKSVLSQMIEIHESSGSSVLAVQMVKPSETDQYGIVELRFDDSVKNIIEKPSPSLAPSNLGVVGRYILNPSIFEELEKIGTGSGGEIQLTDAICQLLAREEVLAHRFAGTRYDCGSKLGYLKANFDYALMHPEMGPQVMQYLQEKWSQK
jgi:UTP--glucose-1-phosphate uridylyltransferase